MGGKKGKKGKGKKGIPDDDRTRGELVHEDEQWEAYVNLDLDQDSGEVEVILDWRNKHSLEELKQICIDKGYSAVRVGEKRPHARFRTFDYQVSKSDCGPMSACDIWINKKSACRNVNSYWGCGEIAFEDEDWYGYKNIDMNGQGDKDIIHNWKEKHADIEELKQMVIEKGYSAVTVGAGENSFDLAALKDFPFVLTKEYCRPVTETHKHECIIYIWKHNKAKVSTEKPVTPIPFRPDMDQNLVNGAFEGDLQKVKDALEGGAYIEAVGDENSGWGTALHAASRKGHKTIMKFLISQGANIHSQNENGHLFSCLHQAAYQGRKKTSELLVEHGADVNARVPDNAKEHAGLLPWEIVGKAHEHRSDKHEVIAEFLKKDCTAKAPDEELGFYADGPSLWLVLRDSPRRCIFQHAKEWTQSAEESSSSFPMTLANGEFGVCCKTAKHERAGPWSYKKLVLGPKDQTMNVHFKDKVLFRSSDNDVMDISHWSLEEGNDLNMLHGPDDDETFRHHDMRGRSFVVNEDGTMSPAPAPWLCLGIGLPRMCLVEKSSPKALHFANRPEGVFQLALAGAYKGFGITNMYEGTKRHGEWSYTEIVIGSADDALSAHFDENFLRRESDGLALDVAFWKYKEGNHVNWVGGETEERTRLHGGGRDFIPDPRAAHGLPYMLICGGSPNFVLGCNIDPRIYSQVCVTKQEEGAEPETAATEADN